MRRLCLLAAFAALIVIFESCAGAKKVIMFKDDIAPDSSVALLDVSPALQTIIYPEDVVAINVASITLYKDGNSSQVFLDGGLPYTPSIVGGGMAAGVSGAATKNTFLVDSAGNIDYPQIGKLHLAGLTVTQAKQLLATKLKDYLYQPSVEVRIMNFRVTMFGEVGGQGQLMTTNSRMTIIDAIAAAGGIPITGRRDNVKIIRDGGRVTGFVDLNSKNVFNSPFYYLKQNDIIYVEPSRIRRQEASEFLRFYLPTFSSLFATAGTIYAVIAVNQKR